MIVLASQIAVDGHITPLGGAPGPGPGGPPPVLKVLAVTTVTDFQADESWIMVQLEGPPGEPPIRLCFAPTAEVNVLQPLVRNPLRVEQLMAYVLVVGTRVIDGVDVRTVATNTADPDTPGWQLLVFEDGEQRHAPMDEWITTVM